MYVGDFLHTKPAELRCAHRARHVVARAVVHLDNEGATTRTRFHIGFTTSHTYSGQMIALSFSSAISTLLLGCIAVQLSKNMGGWWRLAVISPDGLAPSRMVGMSASVNLPLHHKVQKSSSGTGSPGWSRKKGRKTVVCVRSSAISTSLLGSNAVQCMQMWPTVTDRVALPM